MTKVFHRHCHQSLPTVASGKGVYLYDTDGNSYLDACGGAAVSCLGHQYPEVINAVSKQITEIAYAHSGFFTSDVAERLADKLVSLAGDNFSHAYLVSGGAEAVESAIKLARQYFVERGMISKTRLIARRQSYHGNTLGALSNGGNRWRQAMFDPLLNPARLVSPCNEYRECKPEESVAQYSERLASELEQAIIEEGAEHVMAFIAEPIVGATAGAVPAVEGYFTRVREVCDRYDVLLILDEVMCGIGRAGTMFAYEQFDVVPDIVTVAKGLGAGYQPIGALIASKTIYDTIANGSGFFQHGHTFMAHPAACAAGVATLEALTSTGIAKGVTEKGEYLVSKLQKALGTHPYIGDIRGKGLFIGLELVADRHTKQPITRRPQLASEIKQQAMQLGLMCYPMGGTIDGRHGHHILLAPPFIITESEMDELVEKLVKTLELVFVGMESQ
ncbi:aspartate aminotransferase family protein [Thaumasiovibrio subtropicus]|uniref:aspartate aminotransferase family protein n=1 Tax=Thaumasiovibrio subtropicus TaxID=1891207 RepID=UPI000B34B70B|nr:aspartate aminotransferase family protein [Thaumasiovibrio subtropicus]